MYGKHSSDFQSSVTAFFTSDLFQIVGVKDMPVSRPAIGVLSGADEMDGFVLVWDSTLDDRVFHIHKIQKIPAFVNRDSLHPAN